MKEKELLHLIKELFKQNLIISQSELNNLIQVKVDMDFLNLYNKYPLELEFLIISYKKVIKFLDYRMKKYLLRYKFGYENACMENVCVNRECKENCPTDSNKNETKEKNNKSKKIDSVNNNKYCLNSLIKINYNLKNVSITLRRLQSNKLYKERQNDNLFYITGQIAITSRKNVLSSQKYYCKNKLCRNPTVLLQINNLYLVTDKVELVFVKNKRTLECFVCKSKLEENFSDRVVERKTEFRLFDGKISICCITDQISDLNGENDSNIAHDNSERYNNPKAHDRFGCLGYLIREKGRLVFFVIKLWKISESIKTLKCLNLNVATNFIFENAFNTHQKKEVLISNKCTNGAGVRSIFINNTFTKAGSKNNSKLFLVLIFSLLLHNNYKIIIYSNDILWIYRLACNFYRFYNKRTSIGLNGEKDLIIHHISEFKRNRKADFVFMVERDDEIFDYHYGVNDSCEGDYNGKDEHRTDFSPSYGIKTSYTTDREKNCDAQDLNLEELITNILDESLLQELQITALRLFAKNKERVNTSKIIFLLYNLINVYHSILNRDLNKEDLMLIERLVGDRLME